MRAVIADQWSVLRNGVAAVLAQCGITTVAHHATGIEVVASAAQHGATLVVVGSVPDVSALGVVDRARRPDPPLRTLVLLESITRETAVALLDAGADAVVPRDTGEVELREAALRLLRGERHLAPAVVAMAFGPTGAVRSTDDHGLTQRERAVLRQLVEGRSNREIAAALFIGEATVKTHLRNIYDKLGVANRVQAVGLALERELLRP
jgi:DNA-binding NarL/FixJ family response regulator